MTTIRTTVPKLPKGMGQKRGCQFCGKAGGRLTYMVLQRPAISGWHCEVSGWHCEECKEAVKR